jgi:adenylyltransferase/sulfurtransferase
VPQTSQHNTSALEVSPQEVARLLSSNADFLLIDCRKPEEHEQSRITGSTLIPMHDLDLQINWLRERQGKAMIIHCRSGRRSMSMTLLLRELGFPNVKSMAGGIERWQREIDAQAKA